MTSAQHAAEYKQVTVLFADVVHSMDIAAAVGAERLREIMSALLDISTAVVNRYGGTVSQFTGDGIMAVFGAPIGLEDHAFRACLAALEIQKKTNDLGAEVGTQDGITLELRIGLNSGRVIAGEIGSSTASYTTIGEHVGIAQRMESVAPPGNVMLSESTARLVENTAVLGTLEMVHIKGADDPVPARRLIAIADRRPLHRTESAFVGRARELDAIISILDEAINGVGCVVNIMGPPGIGKSRLVREAAAIAANRGADVFTTYCESHTTDIPFHVVARLLQAATGIDDLDRPAARARIRERFPGADQDDLLILDDFLGIRDAAALLPEIAADARRRRLTTLINSASLARETPTVFVIDDVQWIDEVSESMLAELLAAIKDSHSLVLITFRPEYGGMLTEVTGSRPIALRPLSDVHAAALISHLLGSHTSLDHLADRIAERAAGNPFFAEEMVRDLAERGVLDGERGAYQMRVDVADVDVPDTLQAAIGARIDRLGPTAKQTLNAAAVIGSRFDAGALLDLVDGADVGTLIANDLAVQVRSTPSAEYSFRHPLIRAVAYESQLRSDRAKLHQRLAAKIEARGTADESAALIAEHLEAAGDLHAAFAWHMRAGGWSNFRDIAAAQTSWRRARQVADRLPQHDPKRTSMRIAPRTFLCGTAWRAGGGGTDTGFDELRDMCTAAGELRSLAVGMAGRVMSHYMNGNRCDASRLASELDRLLETIADPTLTVALLYPAMVAKQESCEMAEVMRLAERMIDLADGNPAMGNLVFPSPLTFAIGMRGVARWCLGIAGWNDDFREAMAMARERAGDPTILAGVMWMSYPHGLPYGVIASDATAMRDATEFSLMAEQFGDDLAVEIARTVLGIVVIHHDGPQRDAGLDLLGKARERAVRDRFALLAVPIVDINIAQALTRYRDLDSAIALARSLVDDLSASGKSIWTALAITTLVEPLLQRASVGDLDAARAATDSLADMPTEPGFVLNEITLLRLRALLAQAHGDDVTYRDYRDRYRRMANDLGFTGHMEWAAAMD